VASIAHAVKGRSRLHPDKQGVSLSLTVEITPLTVIPYKPKLQKPSNRNVQKPFSKPFVRQPGSFNTSQRIDSDESSAGTVPENSSLAKNAEDCGVAAGNAVGLVNDPKSAEGTHLDRLFPSNRLNLTNIYRPGQARKRVGSEK
jgi:hypothetical protein